MFSGNGRDFRRRRRDSNQGWRWSSLVSNCPSCLQGREGLNGSWCSSRENLFQTITDISTVVNLKQKYLWKTNSVETFLWYKLKTWNCQNALFLDYQCSQEIPYPTWKSSRTRIFHGRIYFRFRKAEIPVTHVPEFSLKTPESKHSLQFAFSTGVINASFHTETHAEENSKWICFFSWLKEDRQYDRHFLREKQLENVPKKCSQRTDLSWSTLLNEPGINFTNPL